MKRPIQLVDVFGVDDFTGNPLAVIANAEDLSTDEMQSIARWLNLSETAFLLPPKDPKADYRVRIFTLASELPFAGHPTLGSCHAWLKAGGQPHREGVVVQECGAGLVNIRQIGDRLAFAAPPLVRSGVPTEAEIVEVADVLQISRGAIEDAQWVDNGPGWIAVMLASAADVLAVEPARYHNRGVFIGIVGMHANDALPDVEVRAFFSDAYGNLIEDPVTGSLNASLGQWLFASERMSDHYIAAQGTRLGRFGRVEVTKDVDGQVWVGGCTKTLFDTTG